MANNYIAIILPEYDDVDNVITSQDWKRNDLPDDNSLREFIKHLDSFIYFYEDEECNLMYDAKNVLAFTYCINVLPEYYPGYDRKLRSVLNKYKLKDWRKSRESSENDEYTLEDYSNIKDETRTEIALRMCNNPDDSFLLTVYIPNYAAKDWQLSNGRDTYCIESRPLLIKEVFEWISSHRHPKRAYNWNPKHGENGKGAHPANKGDEVSVLLCPKEHAAEIMQKAIGEPMYDTLHCFDDEYGKYMEYKAECKHDRLPKDAKIRNYHSYHIDNDSSIPNKVKRKLEILAAL